MVSVNIASFFGTAAAEQGTVIWVAQCVLRGGVEPEPDPTPCHLGLL